MAGNLLISGRGYNSLISAIGQKYDIIVHYNPFHDLSMSALGYDEAWYPDSGGFEFVDNTTLAGSISQKRKRGKEEKRLYERLAKAT